MAGAMETHPFSREIEAFALAEREKDTVTRALLKRVLASLVDQATRFGESPSGPVDLEFVVGAVRRALADRTALQRLIDGEPVGAFFEAPAATRPSKARSAMLGVMDATSIGEDVVTYHATSGPRKSRGSVVKIAKKASGPASGLKSALKGSKADASGLKTGTKLPRAR